MNEADKPPTDAEIKAMARAWCGCDVCAGPGTAYCRTGRAATEVGIRVRDWAKLEDL